MNKHIIKYIFASLAVLVIFSSCKKEYEKIEAIDDAKIQAYIKQNGISAVKDETGFYYQILDQGTGEPMLNKDSVFYTMTTKSLTGQVYYSTAAFSKESGYLGYNSEPYRIALSTVNRGGKVRVILPSYLAFGKNGKDLVPPNEVIVTELSVSLEKTQWEVDDVFIRDFLTAKGITAIKNPSRIYSVVSQIGSGTEINAFSTITVKYTGRFLSGTIFDQSVGDATLVTDINNVVLGWKRALVGMKKGAKIRIFIPSDLGYGLEPKRDAAGVVTIPANSILDFDIEVVDVTN